MIKTSLFKCPQCGAITCLPYTVYDSKCITCKKEMVELNEEFDLAEIISDNTGLEQHSK